MQFTLVWMPYQDDEGFQCKRLLVWLLSFSRFPLQNILSMSPAAAAALEHTELSCLFMLWMHVRETAQSLSAKQGCSEVRVTFSSAGQWSNLHVPEINHRFYTQISADSNLKALLDLPGAFSYQMRTSQSPTWRWRSCTAVLSPGLGQHFFLIVSSSIG